MTDRTERIDAALRAAFSPTDLLIKDQTHLHAGHAGAEGGLGHFEVQIMSDAFSGKNPIERHRMVYDALGELMLTDIHALKIRATAPDES